jgi:hypothetical protein
LRGNDLGAFEVNSNNGLIRVRDPEMIDFEKNREFVLTVAGQGLGEDNLVSNLENFLSSMKRLNRPEFFSVLSIFSLFEYLKVSSLPSLVDFGLTRNP